MVTTAKYYTIRELAAEFDVSPRTLRFYEEKGLLTPQRVGGNRIYHSPERSRVATVLNLRKLGFTLAEIGQMLADAESGSDPKLTVEQLDSQIEHLQNQKSQIDRALSELKSYRKRAVAAPMGDRRAVHNGAGR